MGNKRSNQKRQQMARKKAGRRAARRKGGAPRIHLSALLDRAGRWPIRDCVIGSNWKKRRLASILIERASPQGGSAIGAFLVDLGCLGVKNAFVHLDMPRPDFEAMVGRLGEDAGGMVPCEPGLARAIIETAVAYAADLGFSPDPDFRAARRLLGDIDASGFAGTIECGEEGKPLYIAGPRDNPGRILQHLEQRLGPDGFRFISPLQ